MPVVPLRSADRQFVAINDDRSVHGAGIVVLPIADWPVYAAFPPLESLERPIAWLTWEQRPRMEPPDFDRLLQEHIAAR